MAVAVAAVAEVVMVAVAVAEVAAAGTAGHPWEWREDTMEMAVLVAAVEVVAEAEVAEVVAELERAPPVPVVLPSVVAQVGLGRQQSPMAVMVFNRAAAAVP